MNTKMKPLGLWPSLLIFLVTASVLRITHYVFAPTYQAASRQPYLAGYLIGWVGTMFLVFCASLVAYKLENRTFTKGVFVARFRLGNLNKGDWLWTLAMVLVAVLSLTALSFTQPILKRLPFFAPHPAFPADMVDMAANLTAGTLFGMELKGQWWLVLVYALGWFLNIAGEEFWYRGWMLPRQEAAFGKYAWLVNGLMFNFQHTFQPWNLVAMLPGSLFVSYAVQRRGKTWMSLVWHGLLNASLFFFILGGVIG